MKVYIIKSTKKLINKLKIKKIKEENVECHQQK